MNEIHETTYMLIFINMYNSHTNPSLVSLVHDMVNVAEGGRLVADMDRLHQACASFSRCLLLLASSGMCNLSQQ